MNALTQEWVDKAEGDFHSALREVRAKIHPNYNAACFHAQQCVEKYLKAHLQEAGVPFRRIHDLEALLNLCLPIQPGWSSLRADLQVLDEYAVDVRYPGADATLAEARTAVNLVRKVRRVLRAALGLS